MCRIEAKSYGCANAWVPRSGSAARADGRGEIGRKAVDLRVHPTTRASVGARRFGSTLTAAHLAAEPFREEADADRRVEVARAVADAIHAERSGAFEPTTLGDRSAARRNQDFVPALACAARLVDLAALAAESADAREPSDALGVAVAGRAFGAIGAALATEHAARWAAFADLIVGTTGGAAVGDAAPDFADRAIPTAISLAAALPAGVDRSGQGRQAERAGAVEALARVAVAVEVALRAALACARVVDQATRCAAWTLVVGAAVGRRGGVVTTAGEGQREERGPEAKGAHAKSLPSSGTEWGFVWRLPTRGGHMNDTQPNDRQPGVRRFRSE